MVRDDKWETYENRLAYTLAKILLSIVEKRIQELSCYDNAYSEVQQYCVNYEQFKNDVVAREIDTHLKDYLLETDNHTTNVSDQVYDKISSWQEKIRKTIEFLKRTRRLLLSFWNTQLFNALKNIPNVEVNINHFIMTNVLMNHQHYSSLPKIQKEILRSGFKELSKTQKNELQKELLRNITAYALRCIKDIQEKFRTRWNFLNIKLVTNEQSYIEIQESSGETFRIVVATSKPTELYLSSLKDIRLEKKFSLLLYPRENTYLDDKNSNTTQELREILSKLNLSKQNIFALGICPQSIFSKIILQRLIIEWIWAMSFNKYPLKTPNNYLLSDFLSANTCDGFVFNIDKSTSFSSFAKEYAREQRICGKKLQDHEKKIEESEEILQKMSNNLQITSSCLFCNQRGKLHEGYTTDNFMFTCPTCQFQWIRNGNTIKWRRPDSANGIYGKFDNFEYKE